jgi:L-malate glycosyltransferase
LKVLLLADINSIHTQKWAIALQSRGIDIAVFSLNSSKTFHPELHGIQVFDPDRSGRDLSSTGLINKISYLSELPSIRKCIKSFKPDIVHSHYASSYGILGALSGFHPFILSFWGSDIFDFANRSLLTRLIIKFNLRKADMILSTSNAMAEEIKKYTSKKVAVTPFGIDPDIFKSYPVKSLFGKDELVIGTTKSLEPVYGNETLIRAFGQLYLQHPELPLRLIIVGGGSLETSLKNLVHSLKLDKQVVFIGKVAHHLIPDYLNMMDIFAALSISESFGVSVIEASGCELPVVVTNIGGLKEVTIDQVTGLLVPVNNIEQTVIAFEKLIMDIELRIILGREGRERVKQLYNWKDNVCEMHKIYLRCFNLFPQTPASQ